MKMFTGYPLHVITLIVIFCNIPCIYTAQQPECNKKNEDDFIYECLPPGNNKAYPCVPGQRLIMPESSCSPGDVQPGSRICVPCEGDTYIDYHNSCDYCIPRTVCGPNEEPSKKKYASVENRICRCIQCPTGDVPVMCPSCQFTCPTPNPRTPQSSSTHIEPNSTTARDSPRLDAVCTADGVNGYKIAFYVLLAIYIITAICILLKYCGCVASASRHWPTCGRHQTPPANNAVNGQIAGGNANSQNEYELHDGQDDQPGCSDEVRVIIPQETPFNQGTPQRDGSVASAQGASGDSAHVEDKGGESAEGQDPSSNIDTHSAQDPSVGSTHDEASLGESTNLLNGLPSTADQGVRNNGDKGARPKALQNTKPLKDYVESGTSSLQPLLGNSSAIDSIQNSQEPNEHHQTLSLSNASSLNSNPSHPLQSTNSANKVWKAYEKAEGKCGIVTDCSEQHIDFVKDNIDIDTRKDFYAKLGWLGKAEDVSISKLLNELEESGYGDVASNFKEVFKVSVDVGEIATKCST